jgi:hypothetical protein
MRQGAGDARFQRDRPEALTHRCSSKRRDKTTMKRVFLTAGALLACLPGTMPKALARTTEARPKPRITAVQARRVALRKYPHATADRKVALENEEGKWQYAVNVHVRTARGIVTHEVMVGAVSGKIESEEVTTPQEEAREKAAEERAKHRKAH